MNLALALACCAGSGFIGGLICAAIFRRRFSPWSQPKRLLMFVTVWVTALVSLLLIGPVRPEDSNQDMMCIIAWFAAGVVPFFIRRRSERAA